MFRVKSLILLLFLTAALTAGRMVPGRVHAGYLRQTGPFEVTVEISAITPSPSFVGQPVTITVRVTANDPLGGTPTGSVNLTSSLATLCSIPLILGQGSCTVTFNTAGTVPLRAVYPGQNNFLPGTSPEVYHLVQPRFATTVTITAHDPSPSVLNQVVTVQASVSSAGPQPTGILSIYRAGAGCSAPPPDPTNTCTAALSGGSGSCSLPLSQAGAVTICAAYGGDVGNLPSTGQVVHWVSASNTALGIQQVVPSPSVINQATWVYFTVTSPQGTPPGDGVVTVTSGSERCSATLAVGRCQITFHLPNLQQVVATYPGAVAGGITFDPSTSNVWMQRVNAPPTDLLLSASSVDAFLPVGGAVGTFTTVDPNPDETHTYTLVAGTGSGGNGYFEISGSQLILHSGLPQGGTLSIRVRTTDPAGLFFEKVFVIHINRGELPATGFAPASITRLPAQPVEKAYLRQDGLQVEIPRLSVSTQVLGVPWSADGWDASWLGKDLGWLDGTAFPTWQGNSVLVGHNYLPDGSEGPFARLSLLSWGDKIWVKAFGVVAVYEVRSVELLQPGDSSALRHEEKPWLTLITCQNYDEKAHTYRARVVVRAVLVELRSPPEGPN